MTDVVTTIARLDAVDETHMARLLILMRALAGPDEPRPLAGLTKLAKLDFLLRYPTYLERALEARKRSTKNLRLQEHERTSVESKMVRYRFGPWDHRYRRWLSILLGKGLITMSADGRGYFMTLTERGLTAAAELAADPSHEDLTRRAAMLKTHFDLTGTSLMRFIYETFPEVLTLRPNEAIAP